MSATQEDYAYVYDKQVIARVLIGTDTAGLFIAGINTILNSVNPHFWTVESYEPNNFIFIKNISNGNDRWIILERTGNTQIRAKFSDIGFLGGDPLLDANWPSGSSVREQLFTASGYTNSGLSGKIFVIEYVDAFGIVFDGGIRSKGGWRWGTVIGKVINTLNKSDEQHWNGNAEIVGAAADGNSKGGFNGEGILTGLSKHQSTSSSGGWLSTPYSKIRTDVDQWTTIDSDYDYPIGLTDYNYYGGFLAAAPLHLQVNNTERLIPYPIMGATSDSLLGFTRYHRSFKYLTNHGTLIKSSNPSSLQGWFMYRSNAASSNPSKNNTCILWNKDGSISV
jgi:hypothetical protein